MKKLVLAIMVVGLLLASTSVALADRPVSQDVVWTPGGTGSGDGIGLYAYGSLGACTTTAATYLQWDLSTGSFSTPVGYVKVSLGVQDFTGIQPGTQLGLYALPDGWTEATLVQNLPTAPALGSPLKTITAPGSVGTIAFSGTGAGDPLVDYVAAAVGAGGDRVVSFAVMFTSGCLPTGSTTYNINDRENTLGSGTAPDLLLTTGDPNAVNLRTFRSNDSAVTWPLYAGLGALGIIVALGIAATRRKSA